MECANRQSPIYPHNKINIVLNSSFMRVLFFTIICIEIHICVGLGSSRRRKYSYTQLNLGRPTMSRVRQLDRLLLLWFSLFIEYTLYNPHIVLALVMVEILLLWDMTIPNCRFMYTIWIFLSSFCHAVMLSIVKVFCCCIISINLSPWIYLLKG